MFLESGYRPEEEPKQTPEFSTETLSGLFKLRGHDLDIVVANDINDPEMDPMVTLSNQIAINSTLPADKAVVYFPENYLPELQASLGNKLLDALLSQLKDKKIEWGTQILPETITPELAKKMKDAGCSYVDLDFPTTDKDLLQAKGKNTTPENIQTAIDILDTAEIRIGIKLVFGNTGSVKKGGLDVTVEENRHSADNSINFVRQNLEQGKNIARVNFALFERPDVKSTESENFIGYPWNRFQIYSTIKNPNISKELATHIIDKGVHEIGEVLTGQDFYTDGEVYGQARVGKLPDFIDLNHASLTIPKLTKEQIAFIDSLPFDPRHVATELSGRNSSLEQYRKAGDPKEAFDILETRFETLISLARAYLAIILGVKEQPKETEKNLSFLKKFKVGRFPEDHIALAPNTTQAIEWAIGMVSIKERLLSESGNENSSVVISDA